MPLPSVAPPEPLGGSLARITRIAAEVIKASWAWLLVLAVVLGWSIVSGLERRRSIAEA